MSSDGYSIYFLQIASSPGALKLKRKPKEKTKDPNLKMYYLLFISLRHNTVPICPTKLKVIIIYGIESNCVILNQTDFIKISFI